MVGFGNITKTKFPKLKSLNIWIYGVDIGGIQACYMLTTTFKFSDPKKHGTNPKDHLIAVFEKSMEKKWQAR